MMNLDIEVGRDGYEICPNYVTILTRPQKTKVTKYKKVMFPSKKYQSFLGIAGFCFQVNFKF